MGSKTIDLDSAVLHKTIKNSPAVLPHGVPPRSHGHGTPGDGGTGRGSVATMLRAEERETAGRSGARRAAPEGAEAGGAPLGALRARGGTAHAGRGGAAGSGLRGAAPDPVRSAGSRAAPGCRARGGREGARLGHKGGETTRHGRQALRSQRGHHAL